MLFCLMYKIQLLHGGDLRDWQDWGPAVVLGSQVVHWASGNKTTPQVAHVDSKSLNGPMPLNSMCWVWIRDRGIQRTATRAKSSFGLNL